MSRAKAGAIAATAALIGGVTYARLIRPWHIAWGATAAEVARTMPLDDRVAAANTVTTRAVTVAAPAAEVWPWIAQMGESPRAGYYSYTWVERMQGMDVHNARRLMPELQDIHAGDALDKAGNMRVLAVEPGSYLVLGPPESVDWLRCTWAFALYPIDDSHTRLVTRVRARFSLTGMLRATPPATWPWMLLLDPGVFVMERKMLLEIKRLAEEAAAAKSRDAVLAGGEVRNGGHGA